MFSSVIRWPYEELRTQSHNSERGRLLFIVSNVPESGNSSLRNDRHILTMLWMILNTLHSAPRLGQQNRICCGEANTFIKCYKEAKYIKHASRAMYKNTRSFDQGLISNKISVMSCTRPMLQRNLRLMFRFRDNKTNAWLCIQIIYAYRL